jgi:RHS repeat-associated protein
MNSSFGGIAGSGFGWETLYGAYRWDSETAFYQVRNRYLHPKLGVWLSRDPLKNAELKQGPNLYQYVRNNPLSGVDIDGQGDIPGGGLFIGLTAALGAIELCAQWLICDDLATGETATFRSPLSIGFAITPVGIAIGEFLCGGAAFETRTGVRKNADGSCDSGIVITCLGPTA